jgi:hypothetical protein
MPPKDFCLSQDVRKLLWGRCPWYLIVYNINEAHKQCSLIDAIFNYMFSFGHPGKHLWRRQQNRLHKVPQTYRMSAGLYLRSRMDGKIWTGHPPKMNANQHKSMQVKGTHWQSLTLCLQTDFCLSQDVRKLFFSRCPWYSNVSIRCFVFLNSWSAIKVMLVSDIEKVVFHILKTTYSDFEKRVFLCLDLWLWQRMSDFLNYEKSVFHKSMKANDTHWKWITLCLKTDYCLAQLWVLVSFAQMSLALYMLWQEETHRRCSLLDTPLFSIYLRSAITV